MRYSPGCRARGFGLIDVSLGVIAGIGLIVGAVVLFQQISNAREIAQTAQVTFNLSSQIRAYGQSLDRISDMPGAVEDDTVTFDLGGYGLNPDIAQRISASAPQSGPDVFHIRIDDVRPGICSRTAFDTDALGVGVIEAECLRDDPSDSLEWITITFRR